MTCMIHSLSWTERVLKFFGVRAIKHGEVRRHLILPDDFEDEHVRIFRRVEPFTMTRPERVYSLIEAVKYVVSSGIEGDFVECGVWRGGSVMAMALTLRELGAVRNLHLFDTFAGMPEPTDEDVTLSGEPATPKYERRRLGKNSSDWCRASIEEVRENVMSTGYASEHVHFHKGTVEETLPAAAPDRISLLRLDTDFYQSTRHELEHLYPRLVKGGVLLLDDYGHWRGARRAVDEYIRENELTVLLNRVDFAARLAIKT